MKATTLFPLICSGVSAYWVPPGTGIDPREVSWQAPGFNHNIWLTHFFHEGQDAYPLIDRWIEEEAEQFWKTHKMSSTHDIDMSRSAVHQYRMFGLFPVGDTVRRLGGGSTVGCTVHRGEWWLHQDLETEKYWFGEPFGGPDNEVARRHFEKTLNQQIKEIAELAADSRISVIEALDKESSDEQAITVPDRPDHRRLVTFLLTQ